MPQVTVTFGSDGHLSLPTSFPNGALKYLAGIPKVP